ncbi:hypothetical protein pb186bvf_014551 [Paramecium bursaria]
MNKMHLQIYQKIHYNFLLILKIQQYIKYLMLGYYYEIYNTLNHFLFYYKKIKYIINGKFLSLHQ